MIRISRNRKDESGKEIKPSKGWFDRAKTATKEAILEQENHDANPNIYGHNEVRKALEKLFSDKCAYCECRITPGSDWNVDHYRPKGKVFENKDHPGYYWLAYDYYNLLPSCTHCNQIRIDKPRWGNTTATSGGKSTRFPLTNETRRAMTHDDNLEPEDPLLLNPSNDYPEHHLRYDVTGQIHPLKNSSKGSETIKVCNLKRSRLRDDRDITLIMIVEYLKFMNKLIGTGQSEAADELEAIIKKNFLDDGNIYAGLARYVYKYPKNFGI